MGAYYLNSITGDIWTEEKLMDYIDVGCDVCWRFFELVDDDAVSVNADGELTLAQPPAHI